MKRLTALTLLMILLAAVLPAAAEDDLEVLTAERWDAGSGETLLLNRDGTGQLKKDGKTFDGTWEVSGKNVRFMYHQYSDQVYSLYRTTDKNGRDYLLSSVGSVRFYPQSYLKALKHSAEEKRYALSLNENIALDFMSFKLNSAAVYRSEFDPLTKHPGKLGVKKNYQHLFVIGTVKNLTYSKLWLGYIHAEFILDGKRTYQAKVETTQNDQSYGINVESRKTQKLYIHAGIPASALKNAKTAELRFCFYNKLEALSAFSYEGDCFFSVEIGAGLMASIKKTPVKKKTFYKESAQMPMPGSYIDVKQKGSRTGEKSRLTNNKKGYRYQYTERYSDVNIKKLFNTYVSALKKDGYKLERLKVPKSKNTCYQVLLGRKQVGTIEYSTWGYINVYVF